MSKYYKNLLTQAAKLYRHNRQGSFKTKERYYEAYKRFLHFVGDVYHLQKLRSISGKHLSAYVDYMKDKGYSASTIKTDLAAIRFWHDQIPDAKYVLPPNSEFILERRKFGGVDRTWSSGEFNRMIAECYKANRDDYVGCITIARYAGLRLHEVLRIDTAIARKALKDGFLTIKGKGGKIREVPINECIIAVLNKALETTPQGYKLFVPKDKQTHIAKAELQNFIASKSKYVCDQSSSRNLTFHGLRHTCAAEWYRKFVETGLSDHKAKRKVSKLLGHEREDVTNIYLASLNILDKH